MRIRQWREAAGYALDPHGQFLARIQDALGTAKNGDALVEVARNACIDENYEIVETELQP